MDPTPLQPNTVPENQPVMTPVEGVMNVPASKLPAFEEPADFRSSLHWRVFRIIAELIDGWQFLADFKKTITFFEVSQKLPAVDQFSDDSKYPPVKRRAEISRFLESGQF